MTPPIPLEPARVRTNGITLHAVEARSQPGAYRAMPNGYRANFRDPPKMPPSPVVTEPTLVIRGVRDRL